MTPFMFKSAYGSLETGWFTLNRYTNNDNVCVSIMSPEGPYAKLSVNTDLKLPDDEFVAKTYSENAGLVEQFINMGYFTHDGRVKTCGQAENQPILKFTDKFKKKMGL